MGPFTTLLRGAGARSARSQCEYVLSATSLFVGCATPDAPVSEDDRLFALAVLLYRVGRTLAAYALFSKLADRGHQRAARVALAMQEGGPAHASCDATAYQLLEWEHAAGGPRPHYAEAR